MTPNIAVIHIQHAHRRGLKLWIPLFLLWIPVLILSPLVLLGMIVFWVVCCAGGVGFFGTLRTFWGILCGLPGTDVRVCADGNKVLVRIL